MMKKQTVVIDLEVSKLTVSMLYKGETLYVKLHLCHSEKTQ